MRPPFANVPDIRARARENADSSAGRLRRWWQAKYKPPTAYEDLTLTDVILEWYEDLWVEKLNLEKALDEDGASGEALSFAVERLGALNEALEEEGDFFGDPLVAHWEAEIAAGRVPNLAMTVQDLPRKKRRA